LRLLALGSGDDAERTELLLDEHLRVVRRELFSELLGNALRDLVVAPLPVDLLGDEVQEVRHLDHLAVRAARDVRRILVTGVLVAADQFDAVRELRRPAVELASAVGRLRGLRDLRLLVVGGGQFPSP